MDQILKMIAHILEDACTEDNTLRSVVVRKNNTIRVLDATGKEYEISIKRIG